MRALLPQIDSARRLMQATGPYLLIELLLPGGTLLALLLFLYRRKDSRLAAFVHRIARLRHAFRGATERIMLPLDVYAWARRVETRCSKGRDGLEAFDIAPGSFARCARHYGRGEVIAVH